MKYNDKAFLDPAFAVVSRIDPDTYARMQASSWDIHVASSLYDPAIDPDDVDFAYSDLSTLRKHTLINKQQTAGDARKLGVPVTDFLASGLVHEFVHTGQKYGNETSMEVMEDEREAFTAQRAFAVKLGYPSLVARIDKVVREAVDNDNYGSE